MKRLLILLCAAPLIRTATAQTFHCLGDQGGAAMEARQYPRASVTGTLKGGGSHNVPVVFHVLYHTADQNITDAAVLDQLDFLNRDFSRTNLDAVNTPADMLPIASGTDIQFCLADLDPDGNPTSGITHTYTDTAMWMDTFLGNNHFYHTAQGGLDPWDPDHYINIYSIDRSYFAGTSSSPSSPGAIWDVIGIDYEQFIPNHTLAHEMGHYFGLFHIFGGTSGEQSCGDDLVADTPPQTFNYGCPVYPVYSCGNTVQSDMFMNYMDYTYSICKNMFTAGQAQRMLSALTDIRTSLLASTGCSYVGIEEGDQVPQVVVHPNPADDLIQISTNRTIQHLSLIDTQGRSVMRFGQVPPIIDVRDLPSGTYVLEAATSLGVLRQRLLITH